MQAREPETFNTNIFKRVTLSMSEEAIRTEEGKLNELAAFLKENAIQSLIKNLQKNEGIPTDS